MAIGGNNSGKKKKIVVRKKADPFYKKEWHTVRAPGHFANRDFAQTVVNRSAGLKVSTDVINGRVYEANLGDLNPDKEETNSNTKIFLKTAQVKDGVCITNFHGMDLTRHKYGSLFRKGCTFIDAHTDVTTQDGYVLRLFMTAFTDHSKGRKHRNCYAKGSVVRKIRSTIFETVHNEINKVALPVAVSKLTTFSLNATLATNVNSITPCRDVMVSKVKVVKSPKFDPALLNAMHDFKIVEDGKRT